MLFPKSKTAQISKTKTLGFTLVEMLVSISIFAIVSAVVLIRNNEFNSGILFNNLAYEIALSIREMQTYGITVKAFQTDSTTQSFQNGYGVYFDTNSIDGIYSFAQFTDIDPRDGLYAGDGSSEKLFRLKLKPGNSIYRLCVNDSCSPVNDLAITFVRPEPDAIMKSSTYSDPITKATIIIQAPGTEMVRKCVVITKVGQISVQNFTAGVCTP
ncbi:prepilin-type N-terminal cleavage/methylation domain-containing protein [Patescibacteria group bacterium]|nr:MAG: prepilin-type N-terminal cleavage/methylation domain-containing protein [Patescibacteria group bacterium]